MEEANSNLKQRIAELETEILKLSGSIDCNKEKLMQLLEKHVGMELSEWVNKGHPTHK